MSTSERIKGLAYGCVARARNTFGRVGANFRSVETAFVLPINGEAHNFMRRAQLDILKRHGINEGLSAPPHITLKLGFKTSDLDGLVKYIDEFAASMPPIDIQLSKLSYFEEGDVLFLDVEPNPILDQARRRLVRELSEKHSISPLPLEGDRFRFHATLAYGLSRKKLLCELERLSREALTPSFHFEAQSVAMLCHTGRHWITYRQAKLCGGDGASA